MCEGAGYVLRRAVPAPSASVRTDSPEFATSPARAWWPRARSQHLIETGESLARAAPDHLSPTALSRFDEALRVFVAPHKDKTCLIFDNYLSIVAPNGRHVLNVSAGSPGKEATCEN